MFKEKYINGKKVIYSDIIPELEHFFTTREFCIRSSEPDNSVADNIKLLCDYIGITSDNLISPIQTHSSNVDIVSLGKTNYPETDALILNNFEQGVYLNFADCTPIILYDKKQNIAAISHAGWRGTVDKIVKKTIKKMLEICNTDIIDVYAIIGPAISKCCFTVGEDVAKKIQNSVKNKDNIVTIKDDMYFADLKLTNYRQLLEMGVNESNIDICPYCTVCNNDMFFSYRKEHATTNRHSAVIKLRNLEH